MYVFVIMGESIVIYNNNPNLETSLLIQTFSSPPADYKVVREKLATQKRSSRKGLSTLLAKTRPSRPVAGNSDPYGVYTGEDRELSL